MPVTYGTKICEEGRKEGRKEGARRGRRRSIGATNVHDGPRRLVLPGRAAAGLDPVMRFG
jgi:hypothetical protein